MFDSIPRLERVGVFFHLIRIKGWNYLNEEEHWSVYLIALPGKRPPEGIFCYESIKVVQYNNYLIGGETQGFLNYIFRLGGGGHSLL